jgi:hypothetical protein
MPRPRTPLPRIENLKAFAEVFDEVFDAGFLQARAASDVGTDWSEMG